MPAESVLPVIFVAQDGVEAAGITERQIAWAAANGFTGKRGKLLPLPGEDASLSGYLFGTGRAEDRPALVAGLASAALPEGRYRLEGDLGDVETAALAFRLGAYRFDRYRKGQPAPELVAPASVDTGELERLTQAAFLARDLINTPANDLGPQALERAIRDLAARHHAEIEATVGDDLLAANFPMIHAVGRAGVEAPRLVEMTWGDPGHNRVTLVGKGVIFDTGGLDIKSASGMLLMKKDMGGAANVLGLAHAIMDAKLPVHLRVLIPIVENAISSASFRPGDVLKSRKGLTVEIGNTDAEGRLILADALALADEKEPEILIDMATLTGAARVALGPDLPPLYSSDDGFARELLEAGTACGDPLWQLPLWTPYDEMMSSKIADVNNAGSGGFAGSITAALFLRRFVEKAGIWAHLDIYGWAPEARPGRSFGGTDQGIRALFGVLRQRFGVAK